MQKVAQSFCEAELLFILQLSSEILVNYPEIALDIAADCGVCDDALLALEGKIIRYLEGLE